MGASDGSIASTDIFQLVLLNLLDPLINLRLIDRFGVLACFLLELGLNSKHLGKLDGLKIWLESV